MITRQHYSMKEIKGSVFVKCPDGSTEVFSDVNIAREWIRLDILCRNKGSENEDSSNLH